VVTIVVVVVVVVVVLRIGALGMVRVLLSRR